MDTTTIAGDIVIIGAGIVGSALAYFLSGPYSKQRRIILVDRAFSPLKGSTGWVPGFVGQLNESEILTRLAIDTVNEYLQLPDDGFDSRGGLEIATSEHAAERLRSRHDLAKRRGLQAELIPAEQAAQMAPDLVNQNGTILGLYFPQDGAANATYITEFYQKGAGGNGVHFVEAHVTEILCSGNRVIGVKTSADRIIQANTVVIASGIWAQETCGFLHNDLPIPIVPVGHPYMYGPDREPKGTKTPWVRWPEHHVYARDHGRFYGLGSYAHIPTQEAPTESAIGAWRKPFDTALEEALRLLPAGRELSPRTQFHGIFSMTPDNLPLVGSVPVLDDLYMAAAVWVTHAAGCAKFLKAMINGEVLDERVKVALNPARFKGKNMDDLTSEALRRYNDIYKTDVNT